MMDILFRVGYIVLVDDKYKAYINCAIEGEIEPNGMLF